MSDEHHESSDEWNAYFVASLITGVGVGAIFGALFTMEQPAYVGLMIAGAGLAVTLSGLALLRSLDKAEQHSEELKSQRRQNDRRSAGREVEG